MENSSVGIFGYIFPMFKFSAFFFAEKISANIPSFIYISAILTNWDRFVIFMVFDPGDLTTGV